MSSAFENLTGFGKPLKAESPDATEFAGLTGCRSDCRLPKSNGTTGIAASPMNASTLVQKP
ncbi:MAG: hypothetical protein HY778_02520 [Betaproteobacteria bacterium]|nr:hypothetical protein [Betaproteobacteria bacterium]